MTVVRSTGFIIIIIIFVLSLTLRSRMFLRSYNVYMCTMYACVCTRARGSCNGKKLNSTTGQMFLLLAG